MTQAQFYSNLYDSEVLTTSGELLKIVEVRLRGMDEYPAVQQAAATIRAVRETLESANAGVNDALDNFLFEKVAKPKREERIAELEAREPHGADSPRRSEGKPCQR